MFSSLISNAHGVIHIRDHRHVADIPSTFLAACVQGELVKLSRGGYARRQHFDSLSCWDRHRVRIAATAVDFPSAVVVGGSAALWHGLWTIDPTPADIELYRPGTRARMASRPLTPIRLVHTPVHEREVIHRAGVRVTSIARTLLDVWRIHGPEAAFVSICHALRKGAIDHDGLRASFEECPWKGQLAAGIRIVEAATCEHEHPIGALLHAQILLDGRLSVSAVRGPVLDVDQIRDPIYVAAPECPISHEIERSGVFDEEWDSCAPPGGALVIEPACIHARTAVTRLLAHQS